MAELIIYRGLPASGKTSRARAWVAEDPRHRARVNRDDLRLMLHNGWIDGDAEFEIVARGRDALIDRLLRKGISVANDDTNLSQKVARNLAQIAIDAGCTFAVEDLTRVPLAVCIARDRYRDEVVGEDVIRQMHDRYLRPRGFLDPVEVDVAADPGWTYMPDTQLPPAWIVDIDGTLAHMQNRSPFDWPRVGEDSVNEAVRELVWALHGRYRVVLLSGRDSVCRPETEAWLVEHSIDYDELFMRTADDKRRDSVVKLEMFRELVAPRYHVRGVVDDRNQVVGMWRSIGLVCAQVAPGNF